MKDKIYFQVKVGRNSRHIKWEMARTINNAQQITTMERIDLCDIYLRLAVSQYHCSNDGYPARQPKDLFRANQTERAIYRNKNCSKSHEELAQITLENISLMTESKKLEFLPG